MPGIRAFFEQQRNASVLKTPIASHTLTSTTSVHVEPKSPLSKSKERDSQRDGGFGMDVLKRHSLGPRQKSGEQKRKQSPKPTGTTNKPEPPKLATIDLKIESPPLLFIGPATDVNGEDSTGALFSAQLQLNVLAPSIHVETYESRLVCVVKHIHPVEKHCPDCATKVTELKRWTHFPGVHDFKKGIHSFPLQFLFQGHLPATVHEGGVLATVEYRLITVAKLKDGVEVRHDRELKIRRAIPPAQEKHSVRIFPPTNLTVNVTLQPVVHPIGEIPVTMRMDGIVEQRRDATLRWRLRKMSWKVEETHKMVSPACPKHTGKLGGEGKGISREDVRTIGQAEMKDGWKSDFDNGSIELEFKAAVNPNLKPVCDVQAANGLSVTHSLVLELVVAEEWSPKGRPNQVTPTGAARILRTQFNLTLTERMGMGIAWDQEMPPTYDDVPPSPPGYNRGVVDDLDAASLAELDDYETAMARPPPMPMPAAAAQRGRLTLDDLADVGPSESRRAYDEDDPNRSSSVS
ncbi:MAG: hypothetical protein INR71_00365 [Terriglobus roseus]|nr:hypothetical protein [Terriglobus roseus]